MRSELGGIGEQVLLGDTQFYNVLVTSKSFRVDYYVFISTSIACDYFRLLVVRVCTAHEACPHTMTCTKTSQ